MIEGQPTAMEIKSRVKERLEWGLETTCRLATSEDRNWPALVRDLSSTGIGLVLDAHLEAGSELTIAIPNSSDPLHVRVVHATALPGGQWLLGCCLPKPLTEEEIQQLLARTRKPEA